MGKVVVISGTDTEVGKTFCGAALARCMVERGLSTIAIKPVESGVGATVDEGEDGCILARATFQSSPTQALQRLRAPLAPPDAADIEKTRLEFGRWIGAIRGHQRTHDIVLVEGAGGLLSPLTWKETALSMAEKLDASVVLVASDRLGTLNHSLLAMSALQNAGIRLDALVFSAPMDSDRSTGRNATALARFSNFPRISTVPGMASWEVASGLMNNVVDWILDE